MLSYVNRLWVFFIDRDREIGLNKWAGPGVSWEGEPETELDI